MKTIDRVLTSEDEGGNSPAMSEPRRRPLSDVVRTSKPDGPRRVDVKVKGGSVERGVVGAGVVSGDWDPDTKDGG